MDQRFFTCSRYCFGSEWKLLLLRAFGFWCALQHHHSFVTSTNGFNPLRQRQNLIWVLVCSVAPPSIRYANQWIQPSSPMTKSFACTLEHLPSARRISAWSLPDHSSCSHHSSSRDICHHDFGVTDLPPARPFLLTVCFAAPFSPFPPSGRT